MGKLEDEAIELALRAAFLCDREDGEPLDLKLVLKDAQTYSKKFSSSGHFKSTLSDLSNSQTAQEAVIKSAFKGLEYVYDCISEKIHTAQEKNEALMNEIESGYASFRVPKRGTLSSEARSMKAFYELADKAETPYLIRYLGLTKQDPKELTGETYYRVLPLFQVSKDACQSLASPSMLDEVRTDINIFLSVELPEVLGVLKEMFRKSSTSRIPFQATPEKTQLARIMILALCRLLWALSYQVDLKDATPSTTRQCFERCSRAQIYLNSILNASKPPCLSNITKEDKLLINFIRSTDDLVKDLRHAYATEQLHELNMDNLTNGVYKSLDILTKGIFTLLYRRHDSGEEKYLPDETAAASIKKDLAALTRLLKPDDSRLELFRKYASYIKDVDFLNKNATTLIDVLIIFCHLAHSERKNLMGELNARRNEEESEVEWSTQLARRLKIFEKHFITPVEYPGEVYKDSSEPFNPHSFFSMPSRSSSSQDRARSAGRKLIPFLTLLMATRFPTAYALSGEQAARVDDESYLDSRVDINRSGWQQLQAINEQAKNQAKKDKDKDNTGENAYFSCRISSFIYDSADINPQLDILPELHERMRGLAQLLELVFKMHKQLSKNQIFHDFFIDCLDWVRNEHTRLGKVIAQLKIKSKDGVNRYIQEILLPMELDLIKNFKEIQQAVKDSKRTVTDSGFMERIEDNSAKDIEDIHKLVGKLFNKDSQLLQLIAPKSNSGSTRRGFIPAATSSSLSRSSSEENRALQKYVLEELMEHSYQSMSYVSRFYSNKGPLLKALIAEVRLKSALSDQELHEYLEKLIRIASSYRKTWFFPLAEARYGATETMKKTILPAMQNAKINAILPFSFIVFNENNVDLTLMTNEKIIKALDKQCKKHDWERSEDEIFKEDFLTSSSPDLLDKYSSAPERRRRRFFNTLYAENNHASFELTEQTRTKCSDDSLTVETGSGNSVESKDSVVHF